MDWWSINVTVAQLGARRHYLVPRAFELSGELERLYTDTCGVVGMGRVLRHVPGARRVGSLRSWIERRPEGIPARKIRSFDLFGLEYARRRAAARNVSETTANWLWGGQRFGQLVLDAGLGDASAVYCFNSAALEIFGGVGGRTKVLDQTIAPRSVERDLLREEVERFPHWEKVDLDDEHLDAYCRRERDEWQSANRIICGSSFVRDTLVAEGAPAERCHVVHYPSDATFSPIERSSHGGPLRVLTVGTVGLRKGSPYALETAKRMKGRATFRIVGPVKIGDAARRELAEHVELTGSVARSAVQEHLAWADVFLLPSLCEGSANAALEAMSSGLPVICTPNTGSVAQDQVHGVIVPPRDVEAIVEACDSLMDRRRRQEMGAAAAEVVCGRRLDAYAADLLSAINGSVPKLEPASVG